VVPLAPQRYKVQFTARAETYEKLRLAQDLLRHQIPDGDLDQLVCRALTVLLEDLARQKLAATDRPRAGRPTAPGSRHIPAEVKRAVWLRDNGRCAFVGVSGRRCTATSFLEFHHVQPHALGGEPAVDNIQLRCRAHNVYEADLCFGPAPAGVREARGCYSVRTEFGYHVGTLPWGWQRYDQEATMEDLRDTPAVIIALERAALDRWGNGDPSGFLEISDPDVVYFDPYLPRRIDGLEALRRYYEPARGKIHIDRYELLNPHVQVHGDAAVLTFNYVSHGGERQSRWNCTEVYFRREGRWRIVQTHWSFTEAARPEDDPNS
jgi:5-methylcytosine-specific restriction endonuclease McrA